MVKKLTKHIKKLYRFNGYKTFHLCYETYYRRLFQSTRIYDEKSVRMINFAVETASGGQINLDLEETIYNTGNIFEI